MRVPVPLPRYTPKPFMPTAGGVRLLGDPVDALRRRGNDWRATLKPGDYTAMLDYNRRLAANPSLYTAPAGSVPVAAPRPMSTAPLVAGAAHDAGQTYRSPYGSANVNFSGRKSAVTAANPNLTAPPVRGDFGSFDPVSGRYTSNAAPATPNATRLAGAYAPGVDLDGTGPVSPTLDAPAPASVTPPMLTTPQIGSGLAPLEATPTGGNPLADAAQQTVGDRVGAGIDGATAQNAAMKVANPLSTMMTRGRMTPADVAREEEEYVRAAGGSRRNINKARVAQGIRSPIDARAVNSPQNSNASSEIRAGWDWSPY